MTEGKKLTLATAQAKGRLEEFIALHKGETGDADAFDATLRSMAGKSKEAPATSPQGNCDD